MESLVTEHQTRWFYALAYAFGAIALGLHVFSDPLRIGTMLLFIFFVIGTVLTFREVWTGRNSDS